MFSTIYYIVPDCPAYYKDELEKGDHMSLHHVKPTIITETNIKMPRMFKVIMHNDNITEMDFVVEVLMDVFRKTRESAEVTMLEIHNNGHGVAGIYTYDIAVSKKLQTDRLAGTRGFPLRLSLDAAKE